MPKQLAEEFAVLARELARQPSVDATLKAIVDVAVSAIEGAEAAAITIRRSQGKYVTLAASDEFPRQVDSLQYLAEEGPCVDSIDEARVHRTDDVRIDPRWPVFGRLAGEQTDVVSMLSHRLFIEDDDAIGALNLYSRQPAAFSEWSETTLDSLAAHVAIALANARDREQVENLSKALESNRTIGIAIGILMKTYVITADDSFGLLRIASQTRHQKLLMIAEDVVATGQIDYVKPGRS
jgi:GAF domain-containing protein